MFVEFAADRRHFGNVSVLPTPVFFFGLQPDEKISVDIEPGKTLIIRLLAIGDVDADGMRRLFFELNGQPRTVAVADAAASATATSNRKAEEGNELHVAAPMPGLLLSVSVKPGQQLAKGDPPVAIEAMKMETMIRAEVDGEVKSVPVAVGTQVEAHDLLVEFSG